MRLLPTDKNLLFCWMILSGLGITLHAMENNQVPATQQDAQKEAADLAIVTKFVHRQLRKNNTPAADSFNVAFNSDPEKTYSANQESRTIFVPRDLVTVIDERKNKEKFESNDKFALWLTTHLFRNDSSVDNLPVYAPLYRPVLPTIKHVLKQCPRNSSGQFMISDDDGQVMQRCIKRYEKQIYRYGKGASCHEEGHITQRHAEKMDRFNVASAHAAGITWAVTFLAASHKFKWSAMKMVVSYPLMGAVSFGSQFLLTQAVSHKHEWQADARIRNKPKILRAMGDQWMYYSSLHGAYTQFNNRFSNIVSTHPPFPTRAQAVYTRAEKLEKEARDKTKN